MKYSSIPSAQILVQSCKSLDISNVVISPGSRNAPLIIGFTEDAFFNCYSVIDERSAGFIALGMALESGSPVLLVCTSGSALLNYYPAIAEAFYSEIPLVVVSADRPSYKIDIGDGQTIRQKDIYKKHCDINAELDQDLTHGTEEYFRSQGSPIPEKAELLKNQSEVNERNESRTLTALKQAIQKKSPAHINIPFEEPLYNRVEAISYTTNIREHSTDKKSEGNSDAFTANWQAADRKMILIGQARETALNSEICQQLAADPSVMVLTETTSNTHHPSFFPSIDSIIAPLEKIEDGAEYFSSLQPDILITLGGQIVSIKIKAFLRKYPPKSHWHLGATRPNDTFFKGVSHLNQDASASIAGCLINKNNSDSLYRPSFESVKATYQAGREKYLGQIPFSDFSAFAEILSTLPKDIVVHFANSSAIRYAQLFDMQKSNKVHCNRGTSGIEGSTSTAIGASVISKKPTVLISGDLGFLYDSNALWNDYVRLDFRMIVINNGGGGIFRILPGKDNSKAFEKFFETTHQRTCKFLCEDHGLDYEAVSNLAELQQALNNFYQESDKPKLLEVFTPRLENDEILLAYFDFLSSVISE
ncbi:MAG: 2-succinyl-5-enolpyruvyl-6-hydroxy-3-cyclohexene-1-carboxylic-acid synthase [Bacteroidia bacterium]|nr:2-succinyl-5-enolpyruvyl-6-hydroxy-3-cyclohexene-1-carboxylic-acid synthase [Bacteroidia bacterium]